MIKIVFLSLLSFLFCFPAIAQETYEDSSDQFQGERLPTDKRPSYHYLFGISSIVWNDTLKIQDGLSLTAEPANYLGTQFSYQQEIGYEKWGWSSGVFFASGRAVAGGSSFLISYSKNKIAFVLLGYYPRIFYRISNRINTGFSVRAFYRSIDWPRDTTTQTIDAGRNINLSALIDLNIRITQKWDLNTAIGPLAEGATLWQAGALYRF